MNDLPRKKKFNNFNCSDQASKTWVQRAIVCSSFISSLLDRDEALVTVADVGCGDQKLKEIFSASNVDLSYKGFDLISQGEEVITLDISLRDLPECFDIGVMLGVIEYLPNLQQVFTRLSHSVKYLVVSHVIKQSDIYTVDKLKELGWINHLTEHDLKLSLQCSGFRVMLQEVTPDERTLVLLCESDSVRKL